MIKLIKLLLAPVLNESGKGGGGQATTTINVAGPTPQHQELLNAQLALEKENQALVNKYADRYDELSQQQLQALTEQLNMQKQMQQELMKGLAPDEQELLAQEMEYELTRQQLGYMAGEQPELTLEEAAGLEAFTGLAKEQTLADIYRQQEVESLQGKNISLGRGLGSSSFRDTEEGRAVEKGLMAGGQAEREIEAMKMQAGWDLPRAAQTFNTGLLELQASLNAQAEQNRASLAAALASAGIMGGIPSYYPEVQGTRFSYGGGDPDKRAAMEAALVATMREQFENRAGIGFGVGQGGQSSQSPGLIGLGFDPYRMFPGLSFPSDIPPIYRMETGGGSGASSGSGSSSNSGGSGTGSSSGTGS